MPKHRRNQKKNKNKKKKQHHHHNNNHSHSPKQKIHPKTKQSAQNKNKNKELHSDSSPIATTPTTPSSTSTSTSFSSNEVFKASLTNHHYDADVSDSEHHSHHNLSPLHKSNTNMSPHSDNNKMQILRSAKISQRLNHNKSSSDEHDRSIFASSPKPMFQSKSNHFSNLSPGFNAMYSPLISQHKLAPLSPLTMLHRAPSSSSGANSPLYLSHSPKSILRSPSKSPSVASSVTGDSNRSVSFGEVEVHEFEVTAGAESDGVPENGGFSLYLDKKEINNKIINVAEYEHDRYQKWKQRAKDLHWNKRKLTKIEKNPEKYLYTAGRSDTFFSSMSPKEREKRLCVDKKWKKSHSDELKQERNALDELRRSRKTNDIFCSCKPLSQMSTMELKLIAQQYDIPIYKNKKLKKGFLINQIKSKVLKYDDICCWDKKICSCIAAGIDCHSGTETRNFQCGCVKYHKKCKNNNGRYVYKSPRYASSIIDEWNEHYKNNDSVPFKL